MEKGGMMTVMRWESTGLWVCRSLVLKDRALYPFWSAYCTLSRSIHYHNNTTKAKEQKRPMVTTLLSLNLSMYVGYYYLPNLTMCIVHDELLLSSLHHRNVAWVGGGVSKCPFFDPVVSKKDAINVWSSVRLEKCCTKEIADAFSRTW